MSPSPNPQKSSALPGLHGVRRQSAAATALSNAVDTLFVSLPPKRCRAALATALQVAGILVIILFFISETSSAADPTTNSAYLFTSFRGNGQDGLRFLYSFDGYHWTNVPGTFLVPQVGPNKILRDPSISRGPLTHG